MGARRSTPKKYKSAGRKDSSRTLVQHDHLPGSERKEAQLCRDVGTAESASEGEPHGKEKTLSLPPQIFAEGREPTTAALSGCVCTSFTAARVAVCAQQRGVAVGTLLSQQQGVAVWAPLPHQRGVAPNRPPT